MKGIKFLCYLLTFSLLIYGCSEDDQNNDPQMTTDDVMTTDDGDTALTVQEQQQETIEDVTDGNSKTWKVTEAILRNSNGEFDISENFNVKDDEFIFTQTNAAYALTWNRNHDIPAAASSVDNALLDYYLSPLNFNIIFDIDSSSNFGNDGGEVAFIKQQNTFTGSLKLSNDSQLDIALSEKMSTDYATVPTAGLTFSEIASFDAPIGFAQQTNVGFTGSYSDNSMFIAHRADCGGPLDTNGVNLRSRILKLDIASSTFTEEYSTFQDFFTRKLNVINNNLVLTGGQKIYTYATLDIGSDPLEVPHEAGTLSRYSTAAIGDDVYVIGGDLDATANKIRKINSLTGALDITAILPSPKVHAGSVIINNKLYIFSGRQAFFEDDTVTAESYIYDLTTESFETFNMPVALYNSYASRYDNLIYIAGDIQEDIDGDGDEDNHDIWLGVYNTLTDEITEITHNLNDSDAFSYIQQLTVFNGKLYVIYGDASATDGDPECAMSSWFIMEASI